MYKDRYFHFVRFQLYSGAILESSYAAKWEFYAQDNCSDSYFAQNKYTQERVNSLHVGVLW